MFKTKIIIISFFYCLPPVLVLGPTCKMVGLVSGNEQVNLAAVDVVQDYTYSEYRRQ